MSCYKIFDNDGVKKAVIFAGGNINRDFAHKIMQNNSFDFITAVDSGLDTVHAMGIFPDCIVGDFDSISDSSLISFYEERGSRVLRFPADKDFTDTQLGCETAVEQGYSHLVILGATGSRIDHMLCSLNLIAQLNERVVDCFIIDENNKIYVLSGGEYIIEKKSVFGEYISFMPVDDVEGFSLNGFLYDLENVYLKRDTTLTVSNKLLHNKAEVIIKKGRILVIESKN